MSGSAASERRGGRAAESGGSARSERRGGRAAESGGSARSGRRAEAGGQAGDERDPGEVAREICLRLLAIRPRTRAELAAALRRRGIPRDVVQDVLERYDEVGIVDDRAFARAWVTSRHHGRGLAGRALAGELRRKGVDDRAVGEALLELDPQTEEATARALVARRLRTEQRGTPDAVFRRLVGVLARKGYPPALAIRVVRESLAEHGGGDAEFADGIDADALADAASAEEARDGP